MIEQWLALQAAGLPSQAEHRSMTNAPHLTLVAATPIGADLIDPAVSLIGPLLPTELRVGGLVLLGTGPRVTVAHLVEPAPELARATAHLRDLTPGLRHPVWMPHLTLARRVPRRRLPEVLDVLAAFPTLAVVTATRLRWWDPDAGTVEEIAAAQ